jgi:transcription termination/antitermination protein NusG
MTQRNPADLGRGLQSGAGGSETASCPLPAASFRSPAASCHLGEACEPKWHVLWTRSHFEQLVYDQLSEKGFHLFLPTIDVWSRRNGARYRTNVPMFPGYLFLHHAVDQVSYLEVCKARGLVKILGDRWDVLADVPDGEIAMIRRLHQAGVSAVPHPYLRVGERVRIAQGLLEGVEGILVRTRLEKGLVVVSVNLLQRSVAVEVDCALVAPA